MPQGRGSNKRGRKTKPKPKDQPSDMIVVMVSNTPEGRSIDIQRKGVRQTEIPTLLRLAAKITEQELGLE